MKHNGKIDLLKFKGAFATNIKGKTETKRCVVIPIEENYLFVGEKAIYFDFVCREISEEKRQGNATHLIAQNFPKEVYDAYSEDEKKQLPIFGSLSEFKQPTMDIKTTVEPEENVPF